MSLSPVRLDAMLVPLSANWTGSRQLQTTLISNAQETGAAINYIHMLFKIGSWIGKVLDDSFGRRRASCPKTR